MQNQMQEKKANEVTVASDMSAWGQGPTLSKNDVLLGKIHALQFMSEAVKEKKGEYGDFRDTINNTKFGDLKTPFEVIPFYMEKKWVEFDIQTNKAGARKREFKQFLPIIDNPADAGYNDDLPYVDEEKSIERDRLMDFYVMIPSEIKEGGALPYIITFKRSSLKAGKKLAMQMYQRNAVKNLPPAAVTIKVSGKTVQNNDGEYVVIDVEGSRATTPLELTAVFEWYQLVRQGKTRVDDSEFREDASTEKVVSSSGPIDTKKGDY